MDFQQTTNRFAYRFSLGPITGFPRLPLGGDRDYVAVGFAVAGSAMELTNYSESIAKPIRSSTVAGRATVGLPRIAAKRRGAQLRTQ